MNFYIFELDRHYIYGSRVVKTRIALANWNSLAWPDQITRQPLIDVPIISASCAYNWNIDKWLARNLVWPHEIITATELDY